MIPYQLLRKLVGQQLVCIKTPCHLPRIVEE